MSGIAVHKRTDWTNGHKAPSVSPANPQKLGAGADMFVHHTAGFSIGIETIQLQIATMRAIWQYHVEHNGWDDIGYNFVVCPPHGKLSRAHIWPARGWDHIPAAQQGYNTGNWAVSVIGNYDKEKVDPDVLLAIEYLMKQAKKKGIGIHVKGHRDVNPTTCPGSKLYAQLKTLKV